MTESKCYGSTSAVSVSAKLFDFFFFFYHNKKMDHKVITVVVYNNKNEKNGSIFVVKGKENKKTFEFHSD